MPDLQGDSPELWTETELALRLMDGDEVAVGQYAERYALRVGAIFRRINPKISGNDVREQTRDVLCLVRRHLLTSMQRGNIDDSTLNKETTRATDKAAIQWWRDNHE